MNYMGSKTKIVKDIVPIIQSYIDDYGINTYIEPFVGGANVIDKIHCDIKIGSDLSPYLIALHKFAQSDGIFPDEVTREEYNKVRMSYNNGDNTYSDIDKGIYGYLSSMNGRFFDGGYAKPSCSRNYYKEKRNNLVKQAQQVEYKNIRFKCCDYTAYSQVKGAVIYCDPPYKNTKRYNIDKNFDYNTFWNWVRKMSQNNIVIISECEAPDDFMCIWSKEVKRTMDLSNRNKSVEKLFIYNG